MIKKKGGIIMIPNLILATNVGGYILSSPMVGGITAGIGSITVAAFVLLNRIGNMHELHR